MPRPRSKSLILSVLSGILVYSIPAIAAEPPWLEIHSTHFTVISDAGDKKGREVALRFEQMRAVFANLLGKERLNQPVPLTILAYRNDKSYYQIAPLRDGQPISVPGFFLSGDDQDFIVLNLVEEESWRAVARDFAAVLLNYNYPPAQQWFDDGLAEYFSSIHVNDKQVEIGGDPGVHATVNNSPGNQAGIPASASLSQLLAGQNWLSLTDLFSRKNDTSAGNEAASPTLYDAESWIVMHYVLRENKLPETGAYFGLVLNQHVPVEEAVQEAYGMSSTQLEQALKDYFQSQKALIIAASSARQTNAAADHPANASSSEQSYYFPVPVSPGDSAITSKPLPESDARALYAEVASRIPERRDFGLKELHALATTPTEADKKAEAQVEEKKKIEEKEKKKDDSDENASLLPTSAIGSPLAHRILAWDDIQHNQFEEASTELSDAAALDSRDMWIRYYLSVLKYRVAQTRHADIQGLPNMMLDLKAVLEWYPELAEAYDLLALARNEGGTPTAALQDERAAIALSPRDERYFYHLAQIYIASKKWDEAEALLDRLKAGRDPQLAALASEQLAQAGAEHKYGIPLNSAIATQSKLEPQKSPFDVLDQDAAKRQAEEAAQSLGPADKRPTKFLNGRLLSVDCTQSPIAILTISSRGEVLKLRAVDYKSLLIIGADDFSCGWKDRQVDANYKPGGVTDGDLVSLEMR